MDRDKVRQLHYLVIICKQFVSFQSALFRETAVDGGRFFPAFDGDPLVECRQLDAARLLVDGLRRSHSRKLTFRTLNSTFPRRPPAHPGLDPSRRGWGTLGHQPRLKEMVVVATLLDFFAKFRLLLGEPHIAK